LSAEDMGRAWVAFRAEAERRAADEKTCCRAHAEEVRKLLAPRAESPIRED